MVPYGAGTWASRGSPIRGSAPLLDARALRDKVRCLAGSMLEAHEEDVAVDSGWVGVRGSPDRAMALAQLARAVHFRSNERLAVVQLDAETGRVHARKSVAVGDGGQLVTGTLVDYAVPPAAERVRRALRPFRRRQAGGPA